MLTQVCVSVLLCFCVSVSVSLCHRFCACYFSELHQEKQWQNCPLVPRDAMASCCQLRHSAVPIFVHESGVELWISRGASSGTDVQREVPLGWATDACQRAQEEGSLHLVHKFSQSCRWHHPGGWAHDVPHADQRIAHRNHHRPPSMQRAASRGP